VRGRSLLEALNGAARNAAFDDVAMLSLACSALIKLATARHTADAFTGALGRFGLKLG